MTLSVLIAVTHLLGAGHLTRAAALARAFARAGHRATLVSGGRLAPLVRLGGVELVQLPPVHVEGTDFARLLDGRAEPAGPDHMAARRRALLDALDRAAPDAVVTELYPFGRRALAAEFRALLDAARARRPQPLVVASIRDVLATPRRPERVAETRRLVDALYDAVLFHGDPRLVPLDASWPVDDAVRLKLHPTGYIDEGESPATAAARGGVVVSGGSSAAGLALYRAAAEAARLWPAPGWRVLVGGGVGEEAFAALRDRAPPGVVVRARPGFRAILAGAALSVSQAGYNTAVDLLATGTPAVLVPFEAGGETEQRLRAERLAAAGLARILPEAALSAEALIAAARASLAASRLEPHGIALDGAARSVALIERLASEHSARPGPAAPAIVVPALDPGPLRAALDRAAGRGEAVRVWWRDDDAVAHGPALDRLLALAAGGCAPVLLAAIPAHVEPSLPERLRGEPWAEAAVHGLAHRDHAPPGERRAEFGPHRPLPALAADAAEALRLARAAMGATMGTALLPVFVPPWNRFAPSLPGLLPGLGYRGLSAFGGPPADAAGLVRVDAHLDPVDWRGARGLADPALLVAHLVRRIEAGEGPIGLLTHHRVQDEAVWRFVGRLLEEVSRHDAARWERPRALFAPPRGG